MKKICNILFVNILVLLLVSCRPIEKERLVEGVFYTNSDYYNTYYSDVILEIKKISNNEYNNQNGVNVVEDTITKLKYSINLLIYCNETGRLEETKIYDIQPTFEPMASDYGGTIEFINNEILVSHNIEFAMYSDNSLFLRIDNDYESLYYNLFSVNYKINEGIYYSTANYGNTTFEKSKVIIIGVSYDEYQKLEYNKIKGVYNNQYLKIELFLYDNLRDEYIDTKIYDIKYTGIGSGYIRNKFSTMAYKGKINFIIDGEIIETDIMIYYNEVFIIDIPKILCNEYKEYEEDN